ncbi:Glyoxalase [Legionella lansingensis]|uniref:Cadmium-induced protein CadI n=1 Tax=Legionella lansingensis TaxID=45067 RepID=A0A0W0VSU1_9GAMM|nr:ArsI/CadI family heavy metal resistance metalloenzyme [Legionella lansingensis]KTD22889.1 Cadmium-induced protein CadI [Legionella lansingensis]SNV53792.1 Glyoxalase [Legionella lansingensis]
MKRFHVHLRVNNLADSIQFYNALFGVEPVKIKEDYAKWMLDDPRINFAISTRSGKRGVDHLGLQVDDAAELGALRDQFSKANILTHHDGETVCCYAKSEKSWVNDPSGLAWEAYYTMDDVQLFSGEQKTEDSTCCLPKKDKDNTCCNPTSKSTSCCR